MPTPKRASMREGPLSQLFRKTAEDAKPPHPGLVPSTAAEPEPAHGVGTGEPRQPGVPSPQQRLELAFAADIPGSLMEAPAPPPAKSPAHAAAPVPAAPPAPARDPYARTEPRYEPPAALPPVGQPVIRVVGVGGAGVNAVNRMIEAAIEGVEFVAINTDLQSLQTSAAGTTLHIGESLTRGLGSGADPELGRQAAHDEHDQIKAVLRGSDMVFIAAGAGGGTGTGAAPEVARIARELGALTVGIITRPFQFEGTRRRDQAEAGITALSEVVDTLIVVPNNRLLTVLEHKTTMVEAFRVADDVLRQGVQGISDLVTLPGLINLDFADVRTIMTDAGSALLGIGMGTGERRALDAAEAAVSSPLLDTSMEGARAILLSITGGSDISLWEVNEACKAVADAAHPDANIIFGAMIDEKIDNDQVWITVVATGYDDRRRSSRLVEPDGEPRVRRVSDYEPAPRQRREPVTALRSSRDRDPSARPPRAAEVMDVPEFMPRG